MKRFFLFAVIVTLLAAPMSAEVVISSSLSRALADSLYCKLAGCTITGNLVVNGTCTGCGIAGVAWVAITGTLSSQTDLQTALNLKAPLTSPSFTTPTLGVATATTLNRWTFTTPATGITLIGTDNAVYTFPGATQTIEGLTSTQSPTNKTFDNTNAATMKGLNFTLQDDTDTTKQLRFIMSGIGTGQTRSVTVPNSNTTLPIISQVVTISGPTAARTYTFPDANATMARADATNSLTGLQDVAGTVRTTAQTTPAAGAGVELEYTGGSGFIRGFDRTAVSYKNISVNDNLVVAGGASGAITTSGTINNVTVTAPVSTATLTLGSGKTITMSNTMTWVGTDGTTMTFPTTSATIARTDAGNTFTGHQVIEGVTSTGATGTGKFVFDTSPTFATSAISPLYRSTAAKVLVQGTGTGATQLAATQTTAPTCSSNCGTGSPSVAGTDTAGIVTMGSTGSPASAWVVTFNGTWASAPACVVQSALSSMVVGKMPIAVVTTTTTMTVTTNGTAPATSDKYQFICFGTQ